ncbi:MAG: polyamine aminopropyltransferase [Magnetococcales bacterium]|nr:polyamine aminopropyltransferase [Magnetococcales bacterium]
MNDLSEQSGAPQAPFTQREYAVLLVSIFMAGFCGLVYELLIGASGSYLLGDSIKQFSLAIGLMMTAMGLGSWLSRLLTRQLLSWFVGIEILLGLVGGLSVPLLYAVYAMADESAYYMAMVSVSMAIGIMIGLELPLLTRLFERNTRLKFNISNVLSLDYLGALAATLLFPFVLLPWLGNFSSSLVVGLVNVAVGIVNILWLGGRVQPRFRVGLWVGASVTALALILPALFSAELTTLWQNGLYRDRVIFSSQTRFQHIVMTRNRDDIRLYLDGHLQFSSRDEKRYHESLVHVPMMATPFHERVLLLGAGDGLAVRELLKYKDIKQIVVVDIDPEMTRLARENPLIRGLNGGSLEDPRVEVVNGDAFGYLTGPGAPFEVILADLPDPSHGQLARLYSVAFYKAARTRLSRHGILATQATSAYATPEAFWSIGKTLQVAGFRHITPYHAYVPSFGDWGFMLAGGKVLDHRSLKPKFPMTFLDSESIQGLFHFPADMGPRAVEANTLNRPHLLRYYLHGWQHWN